MPLTLADYLVESLTSPSDIVLDPMMGSGTTIIAARKFNRAAIGIDIDPMAVLLSRVAITNFDSNTLMKAQQRVLERASARLGKRAQLEKQFANYFSQDEKTFLDYWFHERSQMELFALQQSIGEERGKDDRDFLWLVFSSLIIAKSAGASYALDLSHSRPHRNLDKNIVWPIEGWSSRFNRALKRLPFLDKSVSPADEPLLLKRGDCRRTRLSESSVDFILTSPPYRQAIDYMRTHKFSLVWMGHALSDLTDVRSKMIGTERGLYERDGIPDQLEHQIVSRLPSSSHQAVTRRYLSDMQAFLNEAYRVLKPGKVAIIVIGPSMISASRYDAAEIVFDLARNAGLTEVSAVRRRLSAARRALPSPGKAAAGNNLRRRMNSEFLVAVRK